MLLETSARHAPTPTDVLGLPWQLISSVVWSSTCEGIVIKPPFNVPSMVFQCSTNFSIQYIARVLTLR